MIYELDNTLEEYNKKYPFIKGGISHIILEYSYDYYDYYDEIVESGVEKYMSNDDIIYLYKKENQNNDFDYYNFVDNTDFIIIGPK